MKIKTMAFIATLFFASASFADCINDNLGGVYCGLGQCRINPIGQVFCSSYKDGGAEIDNIGQVKCGRGKCVKNGIGEIYCAKTEGGGAAQNNAGEVECSGACEEGSEEKCERIEK